METTEKIDKNGNIAYNLMMRYVLQDDKSLFYVTGHRYPSITLLLRYAYVFESRDNAKAYRQDNEWATHYNINEVTEQYLFKARLAQV